MLKATHDRVKCIQTYLRWRLLAHLHHARHPRISGGVRPPLQRAQVRRGRGCCTLVGLCSRLFFPKLQDQTLRLTPILQTREGDGKNTRSRGSVRPRLIRLKDSELTNVSTLRGLPRVG